MSLFVSINEIPVLFLALPTAKQLVKDTHVQILLCTRAIDGAAKADSIDPIRIGDLGPLSVWSLDGLAGSLVLSRCPLLALSRHELVRCTCPLSGVKQTWPFADVCFSGRYWG